MSAHHTNPAEIGEIVRLLRESLEELAARLDGNQRDATTVNLIHRCRELAEILMSTIPRLDEGAVELVMRETAATLARRLVDLEKKQREG